MHTLLRSVTLLSLLDMIMQIKGVMTSWLAYNYRSNIPDHWIKLYQINDVADDAGQSLYVRILMQKINYTNIEISTSRT